MSALITRVRSLISSLCMWLSTLVMLIGLKVAPTRVQFAEKMMEAQLDPRKDYGDVMDLMFDEMDGAMGEAGGPMGGAGISGGEALDFHPSHADSVGEEIDIEIDIDDLIDIPDEWEQSDPTTSSGAGEADDDSDESGGPRGESDVGE